MTHDGALRARSRPTDLVCPWCHDRALSAGRRHAVTCARPGCGALYHRECRAEHGPCAVYGCGAQESVEVSRLGLAHRALQEVLAFYLLPLAPRRTVDDLAGREPAARATEQWLGLAAVKRARPRWQRIALALVLGPVALALALTLSTTLTGGAVTIGSVIGAVVILCVAAVMSRRLTPERLVKDSAATIDTTVSAPAIKAPRELRAGPDACARGA